MSQFDDGVNSYLKNALSESCSSYVVSLEELRSKNNGVSKKRIKNAKALLSHGRSVCMYALMGKAGTVDEDALNALLDIGEVVSDQDSERKLLRLLYSLTNVVVSSFPEEGEKFRSFAKRLYSLLQRECSNQDGTRQVLAWRYLGVFSQAAETCAESESRIEKELNHFQYPTKQKASMFGGKKSEKPYELKLMLWASLLSALRRVSPKPPSRAIRGTVMERILSDNPQIARHAAILTARMASEVASSQVDTHSFALEVLERLRVFVRERGVSGQTDVLLLTHILCIAENLAGNPHLSLALIGDVFKVIVALTVHPSVKVFSEAVRVTVENERNWRLVPYLASKLSLPLLAQFTSQLVTLVGELPLHSVELPVVLRCFVRIGRFCIRRPKAVQPVDVDLIDCLSRLWKALHVLLGKLLNPTEFSNDAKTVVKCFGMQRPHLLADVAVALVWVAPDERHFSRVFGNSSPEELYEQLRRDLLTPRCCSVPWSVFSLIGDDLSYVVTSSIFSRVLLFTASPPPSSFPGDEVKEANESKKAGLNSTASSGVVVDLLGGADFITSQPDTSPQGAGGMVSELAYSRPLMDLLVRAAEHSVECFPTFEAIRMLEQIWSFLSFFLVPDPVSSSGNIHAESSLYLGSSVSSEGIQKHARLMLFHSLWWAMNHSFQMNKLHLASLATGQVFNWQPTQMSSIGGFTDDLVVGNLIDDDSIKTMVIWHMAENALSWLQQFGSSEQLPGGALKEEDPLSHVLEVIISGAWLSSHEVRLACRQALVKICVRLYYSNVGEKQEYASWLLRLLLNEVDRLLGAMDSRDGYDLGRDASFGMLKATQYVFNLVSKQEIDRLLIDSLLAQLSTKFPGNYELAKCLSLVKDAATLVPKEVGGSEIGINSVKSAFSSVMDDFSGSLLTPDVLQPSGFDSPWEQNAPSLLSGFDEGPAGPTSAASEITNFSGSDGTGIGVDDIDVDFFVGNSSADPPRPQDLAEKPLSQAQGNLPKVLLKGPEPSTSGAARQRLARKATAVSAVINSSNHGLQDEAKKQASNSELMGSSAPDTSAFSTDPFAASASSATFSDPFSSFASSTTTTASSAAANVWDQFHATPGGNNNKPSAVRNPFDSM